MKKKQKISELKLPSFCGMTAQFGPPELGMDDYYKAVVMIRQSMTCWPETPSSRAERFVIREDEEPFSGNSHKA